MRDNDATKKRLVGVNVGVERSEIPVNDEDIDMINEEVEENCHL